MNKPKFDLGELVRVYFEGNIQGVDVKVFRDLFVVEIKLNGFSPSNLYHYAYVLTDRLPSANNPRGQTWQEMTESRLQKVEPVANEIAKVSGVAPKSSL